MPAISTKILLIAIVGVVAVGAVAYVAITMMPPGAPTPTGTQPQTTTPATTPTTPATGTPGPGQISFQGFKKPGDVLNSISHMKFTYTTKDYSGSIEYTIVGEEVVGGEQCYKVEAIFVSTNYTQHGTLWISKSSGECIKITLSYDGEEQTFTGQIAKMMGRGILVGLTPLIHYTDITSSIVGTQVWPHGTVTWTFTTITISGQTFNAYVMEATINPNDPMYTQSKISKIIVKLAELQPGKWFFVYGETQYTDGTSARGEIVEITLK